MDGLQYRREGVRTIDLENTFIISWRFTEELVRSTPRAEQTGNKIALSEELSTPGGLLGNKASGAHILHLLY